MQDITFYSQTKAGVGKFRICGMQEDKKYVLVEGFIESLANKLEEVPENKPLKGLESLIKDNSKKSFDGKNFCLTFRIYGLLWRLFT